MSANVALSETFDQWRVKTNELLVMTQTDGSPNTLKLTNTTETTSNTTGSVQTAGGLGVLKSVTVGENLQVHGNIHANGAITANGNITLGDAATDTVTISADLTSHLIPNANNLYDLGSSTQQWADIYATSANFVVDATGDKAGVVALTINADDADVKAFTIDGEQTTTNVMQIDADVLTTGSAVAINDDSADTNTRKVVKIIQNNAAALEATALLLQSDGGRQGMTIDKNYSDVAAATVTGLQVDFDRAVPGSGTATFTDIGIDLDVNAGGSTGTTTTTGIDMDVVGTGAGTQGVVGLNIAVSAGDTNYPLITAGGNTGFGVTDPDSTVEVLSTTRQLKLSYDGTNATGFTVGSGGALVIDSAVTATSFSGNLIGGTVAGSTATMTGAITTTDNIAANTASVLTNAVVTADGAIGLGLEQATPAQPSAGKGLLYMKDGGHIYWRSNEVAETEISAAAAAGVSVSDQNAFTASQYFDDQALTSAATVSWNANTQQVATLTLGHNATIANATNQASGGVYIMRVTQPAAPKTVAWSTGYKWPGNTAPTMTATASAVDIFTFTSDGTYMYGSFSGSQNFT